MKKAVKKAKTVTIGSLTYKIVYAKPGSCKEFEEQDAGAMSQHDLTIWIDKDASEQIQLLTLMHEILHAVAFITYPTKDPNFREHFATSVSDLLIQALQSAKLLST